MNSPQLTHSGSHIYPTPSFQDHSISRKLPTGLAWVVSQLSSADSHLQTLLEHQNSAATTIARIFDDRFPVEQILTSSRLAERTLSDKTITPEDLLFIYNELSENSEPAAAASPIPFSPDNPAIGKLEHHFERPLFNDLSELHDQAKEFHNSVLASHPNSQSAKLVHHVMQQYRNASEELSFIAVFALVRRDVLFQLSPTALSQLQEHGAHGLKALSKRRDVHLHACANSELVKKLFAQKSNPEQFPNGFINWERLLLDEAFTQVVDLLPKPPEKILMNTDLSFKQYYWGPFPDNSWAHLQSTFSTLVQKLCPLSEQSTIISNANSAFDKCLYKFILQNEGLSQQDVAKIVFQCIHFVHNRMNLVQEPTDNEKAILREIITTFADGGTACAHRTYLMLEKMHIKTMLTAASLSPKQQKTFSNQTALASVLGCLFKKNAIEAKLVHPDESESVMQAKAFECALNSSLNLNLIGGKNKKTSSNLYSFPNSLSGVFANVFTALTEDDLIGFVATSPEFLNLYHDEYRLLLKQFQDEVGEVDMDDLEYGSKIASIDAQRQMAERNFFSIKARELLIQSNLLSENAYYLTDLKPFSKWAIDQKYPSFLQTAAPLIAILFFAILGFLLHPIFFIVVVLLNIHVLVLG